jgi:hypothetical protein
MNCKETNVRVPNIFVTTTNQFLRSHLDSAAYAQTESATLLTAVLDGSM